MFQFGITFLMLFSHKTCLSKKCQGAVKVVVPPDGYGVLLQKGKTPKSNKLLDVHVSTSKDPGEDRRELAQNKYYHQIIKDHDLRVTI